MSLLRSHFRTSHKNRAHDHFVEPFPGRMTFEQRMVFNIFSMAIVLIIIVQLFFPLFLTLLPPDPSVLLSGHDQTDPDLYFDSRPAAVPEDFDHSNSMSNVRSEDMRASSGSNDWDQFGRDARHSFAMRGTNRGIPVPNLKWSRHGNIDSWSTTIGNFTANIDGTLPGPRAWTVYANNGVVFILDGTNGRSAWELVVQDIDPDINDQVFTTVSLVDLDRNGRTELIFGTGDGHILHFEPKITFDGTDYAWNDNNSATDLVWMSTLGGNGAFSQPLIADINNDGHSDVIIGRGGHIFALDVYNQNRLWDRSLNGTRSSTPAIYRFGSFDRVAITSVSSNMAFFYLLTNLDGSTLHKFNITLSNTLTLQTTLVPSPAVADIDGNPGNGEEIVFLSPFEDGNGRIRVYHGDGTLYWKSSPGSVSGQFDASPAVVDLDGDGSYEIVTVSWHVPSGAFDPTVYVNVHNGETGTLVWRTTINVIDLTFYEIAIASPVIVDLDQDSVLDVVVAATPYVHALSGANGSSIWQFDLTSGSPGTNLWSSPAVADLDHDGFMDIVIDGKTISNRIIDLTLSSEDIIIANQPVLERHDNSLSIIARNTGEADARDVLISVYEIYSSVRRFVGNRTLSVIPADDSREAIVNWTPPDPGEYVLEVELDPLNTIPEIVEDNNRAMKSVTVEPIFPDLTIHAVRYLRNDRTPVDNVNRHLIQNEESYVQTTVANVGTDTAENVPVAFIANSVELNIPGTITGRPQISELSPNSETILEIPWQPGAVGEISFEIIIDPDDITADMNQSNNSRSYDLIIKSYDPGDTPYPIEGRVFLPNGETPAAGAVVEVINKRTGYNMTQETDSSGYCAFDLQNLPQQYYEGDEIDLSARKSGDTFSASFKAYSEDGGTVFNITLDESPNYSFSMSINGNASRDSPPDSRISFSVQVVNEGNMENQISLWADNITDKETGLPLQEWSDTLETNSINIATGTAQNVTYFVTVPDHVEAGVVAEGIIHARSEQTPDSEITLQIYITVTAEHAIDVTLNLSRYTLTYPAVSDGEPVPVNATIHNDGNIDENIRISAIPADGTPGWTWELDSDVVLEPFSSHSQVILIYPPSDLEMGEHVFTFTVESDTSGLEKTAQITFNYDLPDLVTDMAGIQLLTDQPRLNEDIRVRLTIWNNGTGSADAALVEFSEERVGQWRGSEHTIRDLAPGGSTMVEATLTLAQPAQYMFKATIDPDNKVPETNENNNIAYGNLSFFPDLRITDITLFSGDDPSTVFAGDDTVRFEITVDNYGYTPVTDDFSIELWHDNIDDPNNFVSGYDVDQELFPGEDIVYTFSREISSISTNIAANERLTLYVICDAGEKITERDEGNNVYRINITIIEAEGGDDNEGGMSVSILDWIIIIMLALVFISVVIYVLDTRGYVTMPEPIHRTVVSVRNKGAQDVSDTGSGGSRSGKENQYSSTRDRSHLDIVSGVTITHDDERPIQDTGAPASRDEHPPDRKGPQTIKFTLDDMDEQYAPDTLINSNNLNDPKAVKAVKAVKDAKSANAANVTSAEVRELPPDKNRIIVQKNEPLEAEPVEVTTTQDIPDDRPSDEKPVRMVKRVKKTTKNVPSSTKHTSGKKVKKNKANNREKKRAAPEQVEQVEQVKQVKKKRKRSTKTEEKEEN